MRASALILSIVLGISVFAPAAVNGAADPAEQEARAVFGELVDAARGQRTDQFKRFIAPDDLDEMEAMEVEHAGFFEMFMGLIAAHDPEEFTAEPAEGRMTFVRRVTENSASGSSTETTTVTLIRDGGRWVFGKPRP